MKEIFCVARDLGGAARAVFLDDACRDDPAARSQVDRLLDVHESDDGWLESGSIEPGEGGVAPSVMPGLPREIGSYRILDLLGEGGMGVVFRAEQQKPRRIVALKVLRANLIDTTVLHRFEHEAEILGRLHHPGIAHVFEAGTASVGGVVQPFFALELVDGLPLSDHADRSQLDLHRRLELLGSVCDAVHHAHQKAVVHRDLKPANILVDSSGQAKILDFGIARVTDADARVTALQTATGMVMGTLAYMSPEQARGGAAVIDARADVYALGVIGFELVAGCLPQDFSDTSFHEGVRMIVEDDPMRLGTVRSDYRGDLETIFAKALEKDPTRRYASAAALAADLRRFALDEPIVARPPSAIYQLGKFARRHRGIVAGLAMTFVTLVAGLVVSLALYRDAERARADLAVEAENANQEAAKARSIQEFLVEDMLASPNPWEERGDIMVSEVLDSATERVGERFAGQPAVEAEVRATLGRSYVERGLFARAEPHLARVLELRGEPDGGDTDELARSLSAYGELKLEAGEFPASIDYGRRALEMSRGLHGEGHQVAGVLQTLGRALGRQGSYIEAREVLVECLAIHESLAEGDSLDIADTLAELGAIELYAQSFVASVDYYERALEMKRRFLPESSPFIAALMNSLAQAIIAGDPAGGAPRAVELMGNALGILEGSLGADHVVALRTSRNLGIALGRLGNATEAEVLLRDAQLRSVEILGWEHVDSLQATNALADLLMGSGDLTEAQGLYVRSVPIAREVLGAEHPDTLTTVFNHGWVLWKLGDLVAATERFREAADGFARVHGARSRTALMTRLDLARLLFSRGERDDAVSALRLLLAERDAFESPDLANARVQLAQSANELGSAALEAREFEVAHELLDVGLALCTAIWSGSDWRAADTESKLGASLAGIARDELAEEHLIHAFELLQDAGRPDELQAAEARLTAFYVDRETD